MRLPEGKPIISDQKIREVCRGGKTSPRLRTHAFGVECRRCKHTGGNLHGPSPFKNRSSKRGGQVLEIPVVAHGKPLDRHQCRGKCSGNGPGLPPHNLCGVRVLFLGHDRTRRAVGIVEGHEFHEGRTPQNEFLTEPAHGGHHDGACSHGLQREITRRNCIHRIEREVRKSQQTGGIGTVYRVAGGRKGRRPQRAAVHPHICIRKPFKITPERMFVRKHIVSKGGRLCSGSHRQYPEACCEGIEAPAADRESLP